MTKSMTRLLATMFLLAVAVTSTSGTQAYGDRNSNNSGPYWASSYINPDTGAATENADVDPNSSCNRADRYDTQKLSDAGSINRNVHNDACLFGRNGRFDGVATFQSTGVGNISACPDPDGAGPKTAVLSDTNGDGQMDRCTQSGYQSKGTVGDTEYHARLNNSSTPGTQNVRFCFDPEANGCADSNVSSRITINWVR